MITAVRLSALLYPVGWGGVLLKVVPLGPGSNYFDGPTPGEGKLQIE
jgi:hypothetical protein